MKELRKSSDKFEKEYLDNLRVSSKDNAKIDREIDQLKAELPTSLRIEEDVELEYELAMEYLDDEISSTGQILLRGFWEHDDSFSGDLSGTSPGDTLYVARGYTKNRQNVLLAYDKNDKWVGVITNKFLECGDENLNFDYDSFVDFFENCLDYSLIPKAFGGTPVPVSIVEIKEINENGYQHFTAVLRVGDIPKRLEVI